MSWSTRRRVAGVVVVLVAAAGIGLAGGGGDGDGDGTADEAPTPTTTPRADGPPGFDDTWRTTLAVGDRRADPSVDVSGVFPDGSTFVEAWALDCTDDGCTLTRPEDGVLLGVLDEPVQLRPDPSAPAGEEVLVGTGRSTLRPDPTVDDPCAGTDALAWDLTVEVKRVGDALSGAVVRTPVALLVDNAEGLECVGIELVLGLSAVPAVDPPAAVED